MKNLFVSIILFVALCFFIYFVNDELDTLLTYISTTTAKIETLINEDNLEEAKILSKELYLILEIKPTVPSIYLSHQEYDLLSDEATKIYMYLNQNAIPDTLASTRILKNNTENLQELQKISLKNIF